MNKLLAIAVLGMAISHPSISGAHIRPFSVKTPIESRVVENSVYSENIVSDYMDFYLNPIKEMTGNPIGSDYETVAEDSYVVFGVNIPAISGS